MLASLITVALMASANAASPSRPSRTQLMDHVAKKHALSMKAMYNNPKAVKTPPVAPLATDDVVSGYYQMYEFDGKCTDDAVLQTISTRAFGMCFVNSNTYWEMTTVLSDNVVFNVTTTQYTAEGCAAPTALPSSTVSYSATCAGSSVLYGNVYSYVAGTMVDFSTDSDTVGTISYNTDTACDDETPVMSASSTPFGICEPAGDFYSSVTGCDGSYPTYTIWTDSECTEKYQFPDDDAYAAEGDDADDGEDDDFDVCIKSTNYYYYSTYCNSDSAASALVIPSKMLLIAATAAAVATMF